eukprot:9943086-Alexandrium_andersonii.AAC.1
MVGELVLFDAGLPADTISKAWSEFFTALGAKKTFKDALKKMGAYAPTVGSEGATGASANNAMVPSTVVAAAAACPAAAPKVLPDMIPFKELYTVMDGVPDLPLLKLAEAELNMIVWQEYMRHFRMQVVPKRRSQHSCHRASI